MVGVRANDCESFGFFGQQENIEKADEDGDGKVSFDELYDAALKEASQYV